MSKPAEQLREIVDLGAGTERVGRAAERKNRVGLVMVALLGILFVVDPEIIGNAFTSMLDKVKPIVVDVFLMGNVGVSIVLSVMIGRALERMGFTDALVRLFVPLTNRIKVNPSVVIPGVYNILGDINAAGRIGGPILKQAGATRDEQCIAIATMVQSQQSFSCFMLGLIALSIAGINALPIVALAIFAPLVVVPFVLSRTIYRNTRAVALKDLPSFTPQTPVFQTIFQGAREGAELLFLLVIPAIAVIYSLIGLLDYAGVWKPFEQSLSAFLGVIGVHPATGITAIMASPTLAMGQLQEIAANIDPRLVVGAFVLAASGLPLSDVLGQIPAIWSTNSDLTAKEALTAAIIGTIMRFVTVAVIAFGLTPLLV
ncbi:MULTISPECIES: hypothetical protein [Aneurinibacillus]|jgi:hypothetical protein|uniref:Nucleoside transporter/FeoB GTPase Gate domain-containing protein n=1 Tax=Aneurinibacillus danicus TaxID=267746 RepID=A0A511VBC4_9BACL|nr:MULTISPECIES: hypothetical protein [Aneurinibacillus]GEN34863.1 hypothetical protein ADA01nite_23230 [Aneurinibacillus danicus]